MEVKEAERIAQKVIDVLEAETGSMCWMNGVTVGIYVGAKILIGVFDAVIANKDPAGILGIMRLKDELVKKYNSLPSKMMEKVELLKSKG